MYLGARGLSLALQLVVLLHAAQEVVAALGVLDVLNAEIDLLVYGAVAAQTRVGETKNNNMRNRDRARCKKHKLRRMYEVQENNYKM